MNAAYAVFGGDLLGKPYLAVPYVSMGHGPIARRLIALALGDPDGDRAADREEDLGYADRQIIDSWAQELGISGWYEWSELTS
jgi:hypothetical protein